MKLGTRRERITALLIGLATGILLITLANGCAKDRTLEDYQNEQANRDFERNKRAEGVYVGTVKSRVNGSSLGDLKISLAAQSVMDSSDKGSRTQQRPVLVGTIDFRGERRMIVVARDGFFDPNTGSYQASVTLPGSSDAASIKGTIQGDTFKGSIEAFPYSDYGGQFELTRETGASAEPQSQLAGTKGSEALVLQRFAGRAKFKNDERGVSLTILEPRYSAEEDFRSVFVPVKRVQATFNFGRSMRLVLDDAHWDQRTGLLTGVLDIVAPSRGAGKFKLNTECTQQASGSMTCDHLVNVPGGWNFKSTLMPASGSDDAVDVTDQDPLVRTYTGILNFPGNERRAAQMNILQDRKNRTEQLFDLFLPPTTEDVQVSMSFGDSAVVEVSNARWDSEAGTLSGFYSLSQKRVLLDCRQTAGNGGPSFDCAHYASGTGRAASGTLYSKVPESVRLDDPALFPGQERHQYAASWTYSRSDKPNQAILTVERQALSRLQDLEELLFPSAEKLVLATLSFDATNNPTAFKSRIDQRASTLYGEGSQNGFALTLSCQGFAYDAESFSCAYTSTAGKQLKLDFKPVSQTPAPTH